MNKETLSSNNTTKPLADPGWFFQYPTHQETKDPKISDAEKDAILAEVTPYIDKIDPKILKKVFDGWKDRRQHYRRLMREDDATAELSDAECNTWADLCYLGTVFRDYLDTILDLKKPGKSGFELLDSTEKEVAKMGDAMGWFNTVEHMVKIVGDRFDNKFVFLYAIAHEMWHAHQLQVIEEEDSDRSDSYYQALRDYIGIDKPEQNRNQLLEKEAYAFQDLFQQKLSQAMELAPEMKDCLLEETNDEQGTALSIYDYMILEDELDFGRKFYDDYFDDNDDV